MGTDRIVDIFTDGACSGNPGPGGWGAILRWRGEEKELNGGEAATTNNRMEMMAAIQALETLKRPATVRIHTDSGYLRDGITRWIHTWKTKDWKTAAKKPVKNVDLWQRLERALEPDDRLARAEPDERERRQLLGVDGAMRHASRVAGHGEAPAPPALGGPERPIGGERRGLGLQGVHVSSPAPREASEDSVDSGVRAGVRWRDPSGYFPGTHSSRMAQAGCGCERQRVERSGCRADATGRTTAPTRRSRGDPCS